MTKSKPKQYIVEVTPRDIECGVREDGDSCPIALSLRRVFPEPGLHLQVGDSCIFTSDNHVVADLPEEAKQFIHDFDMGFKPVNPFQFPITVFRVSP